MRSRPAAQTFITGVKSNLVILGKNGSVRSNSNVEDDDEDDPDHNNYDNDDDDDNMI